MYPRILDYTEFDFIRNQVYLTVMPGKSIFVRALIDMDVYRAHADIIRDELIKRICWKIKFGYY